MLYGLMGSLVHRKVLLLTVSSGRGYGSSCRSCHTLPAFAIQVSLSKSLLKILLLFGFFFPAQIGANVSVARFFRRLTTRKAGLCQLFNAGGWSVYLSEERLDIFHIHLWGRIMYNGEFTACACISHRGEPFLPRMIPLWHEIV